MSFDLEVILSTLERFQVEFILVGGVAAAAHGAPIVTQDVDIVYRIESANIRRLKAALDDLDAVVRGDPRRLRFDVSHLEADGHKLTMTRAGPLDVLGSINDALKFEDLAPDAETMRFGDIQILVLGLRRLIELKRELGRPKDVALLAVLEATLREVESSKS